MTRVTDIVDNRAAEGFVAEHGLSLLIERDGERILFDTGAGATLKDMLSCPVVWGAAGSDLSAVSCR